MPGSWEWEFSSLSKWLIKEFHLVNEDKPLNMKRILENIQFSLSQGHHRVWHTVGA